MNIIGQMTDENGNNVFPYAYSMGGTKMDLLWTNPSPTSSFSAQTVSLDLSKYNYIYIIQKQYADNSGNSGCSMIPVDGRTYAVSFASDGGDLRSRSYTASSNGIVIGDGKTGSTTGNAYSIPYQIFGIKMSYIVPTEVHGLQYTDEGNNVIQLMNNDGTENLYPLTNDILFVAKTSSEVSIAAGNTQVFSSATPSAISGYDIVAMIPMVNHDWLTAGVNNESGANFGNVTVRNNHPTATQAVTVTLIAIYKKTVV